ncbi:MAG TPA: hypothetical protein VN882_05060 [Steroidobacteraceae bacterium]|nr:hypothetical protein [Steroidobacteraceae bacterium]
MSAGNVTPASDEREEPLWYATVPGFPRVQVQFSHRCPREQSEPALVAINYYGTAEDLIAAGIATAAMLDRRPRAGRHRKRVDQDGDRFQLERYWRSTVDGKECAPYRYFRLTRLKPEERAPGLPGAHDAIAAYNRWLKWRAAEGQDAQLFQVKELPEQVRKPTLRLVVDNTRGT